MFYERLLSGDRVVLAIFQVCRLYKAFFVPKLSTDNAWIMNNDYAKLVNLETMIIDSK